MYNLRYNYYTKQELNQKNSLRYSKKFNDNAFLD